MLYSFLWVIPGGWILRADISEHYVSSHLRRSCKQDLLTRPTEMELARHSEMSTREIQMPGVTQKKKYNIQTWHKFQIKKTQLV
jgi:hypothetical protein